LAGFTVAKRTVKGYFERGSGIKLHVEDGPAPLPEDTPVKGLVGYRIDRARGQIVFRNSIAGPLYAEFPNLVIAIDRPAAVVPFVAVEYAAVQGRRNPTAIVAAAPGLNVIASAAHHDHDTTVFHDGGGP